jgi:CheY-like chemotaxis protein
MVAMDLVSFLPGQKPNNIGAEPMGAINYKEAQILLVEDDEIDAMSVFRAFKSLRVCNPIVRAKDGIEALELLENGTISRPYVILLDLNMPRMGGVEFLQELRKHEKFNSSVVFVLTTSKADEDKMAAYDLHIAGYIVKESLQSDFGELVKMLDHYWKLVELPH